MVRSDGTVAAGPDVVELLPQAAATSVSTPAHALNDRRLSFRNVICTSCPHTEWRASCCLLPESAPGRECAGNQVYSDVRGRLLLTTGSLSRDRSGEQPDLFSL